MFQVLTGILLEYRKPEMMNAIAALWGLHRTAGAPHLVSEYERLRAQGGPLHEQRRLVSQFYNWLGGLRDLELVLPDVIYRDWSKSDLQILPDLLLPIESHLGGGVAKPNLSSLKRLYDGRLTSGCTCRPLDQSADSKRHQRPPQVSRVALAGHRIPHGRKHEHDGAHPAGRHECRRGRCLYELADHWRPLSPVPAPHARHLARRRRSGALRCRKHAKRHLCARRERFFSQQPVDYMLARSQRAS